MTSCSVDRTVDNSSIIPQVHLILFYKELYPGVYRILNSVQLYCPHTLQWHAQVLRISGLAGVYRAMKRDVRICIKEGRDRCIVIYIYSTVTSTVRQLVTVNQYSYRYQPMYAHSPRGFTAGWLENADPAGILILPASITQQKRIQNAVKYNFKLQQ